MEFCLNSEFNHRTTGTGINQDAMTHTAPETPVRGYDRIQGYLKTLDGSPGCLLYTSRCV